ncbi:hypothetical protein GCM10023155_43160 [Bremerella cremea]
MIAVNDVAVVGYTDQKSHDQQISENGHGILGWSEFLENNCASWSCFIKNAEAVPGQLGEIRS